MLNKKAKFDYEFLEKFTAGVMLVGREVKSVKDNKASFGDSYCVVENNAIVLKKFHISLKDKSDEECTRDRKLLLTKQEISKISKKIKEKGLTLIPVSVFVNKTGLIKMDIALAKGKKNYDKRETIKERDLKRQAD